MLHLDGDDGRIELPLALAADRDEDARILELRVYFSSWPVTGGHAIRPPLLQPDPVSTRTASSATTSARSPPATSRRSWRRSSRTATCASRQGATTSTAATDELRALFERFFSNGGGIPLEHCAVTDDGRACALEYNVVAWGRTELPPEAGIAVYVRGDSGKLASARIYDDTDPPL